MIRQLVARSISAVFGVDTCVYCDKILRKLPHAIRHHNEAHPDREFDPLWYSEPEDWEHIDPEELSESTRKLLGIDDHDVIK